MRQKSRIAKPFLKCYCRHILLNLFFFGSRNRWLHCRINELRNDFPLKYKNILPPHDEDGSGVWWLVWRPTGCAVKLQTNSVCTSRCFVCVGKFQSPPRAIAFHIRPPPLPRKFYWMPQNQEEWDKQTSPTVVVEIAQQQQLHPELLPSFLPSFNSVNCL